MINRNTSRPIYIDILCILFATLLTALLFAPHASLAVEPGAAERDAYSQELQAEHDMQPVSGGQERKVQAVHIIPAVLDEQEVYPTRHATVELDPLIAYRWESVVLPQELIGAGYYFELWDSENRPIRQFRAQVLNNNVDELEGNILDISTIDSTVYPMVRLILFAPPEAQPIPSTQHLIQFTYTEEFNSRLLVFVGMLAVLGTLILLGLAYWRVPVLETVSQSLPIISRSTAGDKGMKRFFRYVVLTAVWSSVFGATLGLYVGGIQVLYLLIKLPFLLLVTFLFSFLSIAVLSLLLGIKSTVRELAVQALRVLAGFSISMASLAPLVLFYIIVDYSHDQLLSAFMFIVAVSAAMAAFQLWLWIRTRAPGLRGLAVAGVWLALYGVVLLQFGWMLRPWVGSTDPIHNSVPFARLYSGNVFEEVINTLGRL